MKRNLFVKSLICTILMVAVFVSPAIAATLGNDLHDTSLNIAGDAELAHGVFWSYGYNDLISENYIVYQPNESVLPIIGYGNDLFGAASLQTAVNVLTNQGYNVLAAINADFFNTSTGVPIGIVIFDGEIISSESSIWEAVGFKSDGSAIIGQPGLAYTLSGSFGNVQISKINKEIAVSSGIIAYTNEYSVTTQAAIKTMNVVVEVQSGRLEIGGELNGRVIAVQESSSAYPISDGQIVLSLASDTTNTSALSALKALSAGDNITIAVSSSSAWKDVVYATGGSERLLTNGYNVASVSTAAPRTAIGVRGDGSFILYTVDGRQTGLSAGATMAEVANRLSELGCVNAMNLDGGGSTLLSTVLPGNDYGKLTTINSPSGGSLRSCGNYIFLVNAANNSGSARHIHFYPYDMLVLAGSSVDVALKATNDNYYPVDIFDEPEIDVPAILGYWNDGVYTAAASAASGTITASSGSASGSVDVEIVALPDSISLYKESDVKNALSYLVIGSGEAVNLKAVAKYNGLTLLSSDDAYVWQINGNIGIIDQTGRFVANNSSATGSITVSSGGRTTTITVTVSGSSQTVDDFEAGSGNIATTNGFTVAGNTDKSYVRYGNGSAKISYDFSANQNNPSLVSGSTNYSIAGSNLNFWVYGDGSANQLTISFNANGQTIETVAKILDYTGWQFVSVAIPEAADKITAISLRGSGNGVIYLDQMILAGNSTADTMAPSIKINSFGTTVLSATIKDNLDTSLKSANIQVELDGKNQNFSFSTTDGVLSSTIVIADAYSHIITITAKDISGNISKASYYVAEDSGLADVFIDTKGHWSNNYTKYLYRQGIISGIESEKGLSFQPNSKLNRAQFAVIMAKWLDIDTSAYAGMALPFADNSSIPGWAANSVKAMYSMGVIKGYGSGNSLKFNPSSNITRAEVLTVIGRVQQRGYCESQLTFTDTSEIASWAMPFVKTLVAQGVVSGYDNKLLPNNHVTRGEIAKIIYGLM